MIWLILGVALWWGAHLFKRIAPAARARMGEEKGKKPIAIALFLSIVLMIIGYRMADGEVFWARHPATVGVNNLLMLVSVYLFAASGMKTAVARKMRHPMLWGMALWAIAHLLVNGDVPSFILFGGLLVWSFAEMAVINRAVPHWLPPEAQPKKKEAMALAGTLIVYGVIVGIHYALGYPTFG